MKDCKVKVAQSQGGRSWKPGDTRTLTDQDARALTAAGLVEPIEPKPKPAPEARPKKRSRRKKAAP